MCRDLVDEAKNYLLLPQERPQMQGPRTRPRKPIRCGEVLFAGQLKIKSFSLAFVVEWYDMEMVYVTPYRRTLISSPNPVAVAAISKGM